MRILMLAPGNVVHSLRPLNALLEREHEVIFVDGENPFPEGKERFLYIPYVNSSNAFAVPMLKRIWEDLKPDLVHIHWVDHRAYQCLKADLKPLVLTVWGSDINNYFNPSVNRQFLLDQDLMGEVLLNADTIFLDTPDIEEKCSLIAGSKVSSELLTLGVDTNLFKPGYEKEADEWKTKLGILPGEKVLLSIRALRPIYNHHQILLAFFHAKQCLKEKTALVFRKYNNRDFSDYEISLLELVEKLNIQDTVKWMEPCNFEQMPSVYALSDYIINYPIVDAFPVTFLEAAACERPVITNLLPAYENTFVHTFFDTVESDNIDALTECIVKLLNTPKVNLKQELAQARQEIINNFDESHTIDSLVSIYSRLINNPALKECNAEYGNKKSLNEANTEMYLEKGLEQIDLSMLSTVQEYYQLGSVFKQLRIDEKAEECFSNVIRQWRSGNCNEKYASGAYFHLGEIYYRQDRKQEAFNMIRECLIINPEHKAAQTIQDVLKHRGTGIL